MAVLAIYCLILVSAVVRSVGELFVLDAENEFQPVERYSNEISWYAPFYSGGGYSSEAIAFVKALSKAGVTNFTITHHGDSWNRDFVESMPEQDRKLLANYEILYKTAGYPRVSICHSEPGAWYTPNPKYHTSRCPNTYPFPGQKLSYYKIGRTMFETDRLPDGWVERMNYMDEIWVPTVHMSNIVRAANVTVAMTVVPEPVDTDFFRPYPRRSIHYEKYQMPQNLRRLPEDTFVFLFVGKFEPRKGMDILLDAYLREFKKPEDNVILIILTNAYHSLTNFSDQLNKMLKERGLSQSWSSPNFLILTQLNTAVLPILYSFADVLVIPSHGEGWGRPHMEAMACGTPVIATNWSGPAVFIEDSFGYLLSIEKDLVDAPGWPGHKWAQPNSTHLRQLMRHVVNHRDEVKQKGQLARKHMLRHFSLARFGKRLLEEFDRVLRKIGARPPLPTEEEVGPVQTETTTNTTVGSNDGTTDGVTMSYEVSPTD